MGGAPDRLHAQHTRTAPAGAGGRVASGAGDPRWHETCGETGADACVRSYACHRLLRRREAYDVSRGETRPHGSKVPEEEGAVLCN